MGVRQGDFNIPPDASEAFDERYHPDFMSEWAKDWNAGIALPRAQMDSYSATGTSERCFAIGSRPVGQTLWAATSGTTRSVAGCG